MDRIQNQRSLLLTKDGEIRSFIPDSLWEKLANLFATLDPMDPEYQSLHGIRRGPKQRIDSRLVYEAILFKALTGCGWLRLAEYYNIDDTTLYYRYRYWCEIGLLEKLHAITMQHYANHKRPEECRESASSSKRLAAV